MNIFGKKKQPKGLKDAVKALDGLTERMDRVETALSSLREEAESSIRHIGLVRYDAYDQAGGKQSFSLAILDENESGVVVTGLFKEGSSRVFVKDIENGESGFNLSPEEKKSIKKAHD